MLLTQANELLIMPTLNASPKPKKNSYQNRTFVSLHPDAARPLPVTDPAASLVASARFLVPRVLDPWLLGPRLLVRWFLAVRSLLSEPTLL